MKRPLIAAAACFLALPLGGCVVAPLEPVYAGPPPPATVVVRPAPRHPHYHRHGGRYRSRR